MIPTAAAGVETALVGAVALAVGCLIRYRRWVVLIAGVAPFDAEDPLPAFVSTAGNLVIAVGVVVTTVGILAVAGLLSFAPGWIVAVAVITAVIVIAR